MRSRPLATALFLTLLFALPAAGQMQHGELAMHGEPEPDMYPEEISYDPAIPTLQQVVGHSWGERITSPAEIGEYLHALAEASPRISVHRYAESWEGRPLFYAVAASEENMARIEEIRAGNLRLTDPEATPEADAEAIIAESPVLVWLAYGVHGNEISSGDAALRTLYHLAAAQGDELAELALDSAVVLVDPMQNPDGRNRFVNHYRQSRGRWPDSNTDSVELNEPWPGGRTNHYLFDLNRDWFAQTQPETRGKVDAFLHWRPQVYIDLHEMGGNSTYYFPPEADPINPNQTEDIGKWIAEIGANNARWFDRMGWSYFQREVFDAFYPGYGVSWPMYQGAAGATYEQASSRGLLYERDDETVLRYAETVQHHFIASLSTIEAAARNREAMLRDFWEYGRDAIQKGRTGDVAEIILPPGDDPGRVDALVGLLMDQGVEVSRAEEPFGNVARDYYGGDPTERQFPAGTYRISMAQPARHLINVLLAPETPMDEEFLREQWRRYARREGDQIYDISGWSLPLLYDVDAYLASEPSTPEAAHEAGLLAEPPATAGAVHGGPARVAYLIPWGTQAAARALAHMHHHGLRVHSADDSFTIGGREYPAGSLIVKVARNPEDLHEQLTMIARHAGADIHATDTSRVESGISFGSGRVRYLPKPRIAIAWDRPTSAYSAGWARYLLEQPYHTPVTIVRTERLGRADLDAFNVLVLPDAFSWGGPGYDTVLDEAAVERIKEWVQEGGTLITLGAATLWATDEEVGLLATERRMKTRQEGEEAAPARQGEEVDPGLPEGVYPEEEAPVALPGSILRARLDPEHWLAFGYDDYTNLIAQSRNIYEPLTLDEGLNVATYVTGEGLLVSGVAWEPERELIAGTPFLMHQGRGGGHVIGFAEDPNFRAYFDGLNLLFLNGVFLGPGH